MDSCIAPIAKITKPMRWLILNLFGGPLGILERLDKYEEDDTDDNDIPTLHIRKKKISYGSIMLLFMLIVGFGILALSSASNLALIQVTHICSEDPDIDCYPQLIRGANETIIDLYNITIDISQPLQDCFFFNSEVVSTQITFDCFKFVYNTDIFLAAFGGFMTLFMTTMKLTAGFLLWINECSICCIGCCTMFKKVLRILFAAIAILVEVVLAIACMTFGIMGSALADIESNSLILRFIAMHAVEILIGSGIIATLLLLPWERYVDEDEDDNENYIV